MNGQGNVLSVSSQEPKPSDSQSIVESSYQLGKCFFNNDTNIIKRIAEWLDLHA